jgi:hypothetical protein
VRTGLAEHRDKSWWPGADSESGNCELSYFKRPFIRDKTELEIIPCKKKTKQYAHKSVQVYLYYILELVIPLIMTYLRLINIILFYQRNK